MLRFYERRKEIAAREEALLDAIEQRLQMTHRIDELFEASWVLEP
jgi:hypothetical protein